jgi:MFS family permease
MGAATLAQTAVGVLASNLIEEFDVERWQIGILVTGIGFTGALLSPVFGRVTDRVGASSSTVGVFVLTILAMILVAVAPNYGILLVAALLNGIPNAWCNPATNALIATNIDLKARGLVTGIKQSGVQMGAFLGGLILPGLASVGGWRVAYASFLVFPVAGLIGMWRRSDAKRRRTAKYAPQASLPRAIAWIAVYGAITGFCVSATVTFLPLFAEEAQGWTTTQAGLLIGGVGLVGVFARIMWSSASERWMAHGQTLRLLAVLSTASAMLLALVSIGWGPSWVLVAAAILMGSGAVAWNAVGMLAVMDYSTPELMGRGTGLTMLGFLTGLGLGAPLMGLSVDRLGSFTPGWLIVATMFAVAAVVAGNIHGDRVESESPRVHRTG